MTNKPTNSTRKAQSFAALMGAEGTDTQFAGLHPWLASKLEEDRAVLSSVGFGALDELKGAADRVRDFYYAAVQKSGEKAYELGIPHVRPAYFGPMVERGELPGPAMFLVFSRSSVKVATVWVQFHEVNALGWGDVSSATFHVDARHTDQDEAEQRIRAVRDAARRFHHLADTTGIAEHYDGDGNDSDF